MSVHEKKSKDRSAAARAAISLKKRDTRKRETRREYLTRPAPASIQKQIEEELFGDNILDHLRKKKKEEKVEANFWIYNPLWRYIEDHLEHAKECVLIEREGRIQGCSAHSGVYLKDVYEMIGDPPTLCFRCDVYYENESDPEWSRESMAHIYVPSELAVEWNEAKWNEFLSEEKRKRDESQAKEDTKKLRELVKKYPTLALLLTTKEKKKS